MNRALWAGRLRVAAKDPPYAMVRILRGKEALSLWQLSRVLPPASVERALREIDLNPGPLLSVYSKLKDLPYLGWIASGKELYAIARTTGSKVIVETGVGAGLSSAYLLLALQRNGGGVLHSIDLPNYEKVYSAEVGRQPIAILPESEVPGFLVPEELRGSWALHLGDTRAVLPKVLSELHSVDIFLHDSEHTYAAMMFEYDVAWPSLRPGGFLLTDDFSWNHAFRDFCMARGARPRYLWSVGLGIVQKPR